MLEQDLQYEEELYLYKWTQARDFATEHGTVRPRTVQEIKESVEQTLNLPELIDAVEDEFFTGYVFSYSGKTPDNKIPTVAQV